MALGSWKSFDLASLRISDGTFNFASDIFQVGFFADSYAAVDTTSGTAVISDYTAVSGGTYAPKNLISPTFTRAGSIATFTAIDFTGANEWPRDAAAGPTNIMTAMIYKLAGGALLGVWDMTEDGVTPASLQAAPIGLIFSGSGIWVNNVVA